MFLYSYKARRLFHCKIQQQIYSKKSGHQNAGYFLKSSKDLDCQSPSGLLAETPPAVFAEFQKHSSRNLNFTKL